MVEAHLELAREMLAAALEWHCDGPPSPLVGGEQLVDALGLQPGPEVGRLLGEIEAAQYAGEVGTPEEALRLARDLARSAPR